jgi:GAF domain-containing protein
MLGDDAQLLQRFFTSGMETEIAARLASPLPRQGQLGTVLVERQPCRSQVVQGDLQTVGLPVCHPPVQAFLGVPIVSPTQVYGWLCLTNKLGAAAFSAADEQMAHL